MAQLVAMDAAVAVARVPASAAVASTSASRHSVVLAGAVSVSWSFFLSFCLRCICIGGLGGLCGENFELSGLRCGLV
jgi:hypothetical protein